MILYHGSFIEISKPDLLHSRPNVDFGKGFYTTPIYEQAVKRCAKFKHRGKNGIISHYTFDESAYKDLANDKVFNTVELYYDNLIDKNEAIRRLRYEKPNLQICFRTDISLNKYLRFERSEQI